MGTNTFEIFHYLTPPQGVSLHHHDFYEIFFLVSGALNYRVEGRNYQIVPGDLLLMSPQEIHQPLPVTDAPYNRYVIWINRDFLQRLSTPETCLSQCFDNLLSTHSNLLKPSKVQCANLCANLDRLLREVQSPTFGSELVCRGLLTEMLVELNRLALFSHQQHVGEFGSELVANVLDYIHNHYNEPLTLDQLANMNYVSKYYLAHEFQRCVGTSLHHYLVLRRLIVARQMLSSGISPSEVSQRCGFGDYSSFYRAFFNQYEVNPKTFFLESN